MNYLDHEELAARSRRYKRKQRRDLVWNVLTGLALLATISLVAVLALIFSNPAIGLNPFPPPTMPVLVDLSTPTPSLVYLPATWTPAAGQLIIPAEATATPEPIIVANPGTAHLRANPRRMAFTRSRWRATPSPWRARSSTRMAIATGREWQGAW